MNQKFESELRHFYFGRCDLEERLHFERRMLTDEFVLLDFLEFKRSVEKAGKIPQQPSQVCHQRLIQSWRFRSKAMIPIAFVSAIAALIVICLAWMNVDRSKKSIHWLIDMNSEISSSVRVF